MNLGKLVREKMKEMSTDLSGEYVDNHGKHFAMKLSGDGYTISYGGEAKREVNVTKSQGLHLTAHCKRMGADSDKKELSEKKLAAWSSNGGHSKVSGRGDAQGSVHAEGGTFYWTVMGVDGKIVAEGEASSEAQAKSAVENKMRSNALLSGKSQVKRLAGKSTQEILGIANQVESAGAGWFQRAGKDMNILFRGNSAMENARRVSSAIGSQASSPKFDAMSGQVIVTVKNAYESKLSIGEMVEKKLKHLEAYKGHNISTVHEINGTYPVIDGKKIDHSCDGPTEATKVAKDMIDAGKVK